MPRLNFNIDEATLLKAYKISTLHPTRWEDIDHDFDETIASATVGGAGVRPEREKEDALGLGPARSVKDLDMETKSALLLSSKTFSPAQYLAFAHPNATYHDLAKGINHLQNAIQAREEALRVLVEENFDRFVVVKSAVDGLYEDMKHGVLAPETEHATKPLRDHLRDGVQKANQISLPVLETASKAERLRTTMSVFERSRFFFNLPRFIMESIDAGKYDVALRDYKKGKYLLENRPGQLLPLASTSSSSLSSSQIPTPKSAGNQQQQMQMQAQQKRILSKVWAGVEKAMGEMRKVLITQLQDSSRSAEDHERTLETLLELQTGVVEESVWTYFDSHHVHIMDKMSATHRAGIRAVETAKRDTSVDRDVVKGHRVPQKMLPELQLKSAMAQLEAGEVDIVISELSSSSAEKVWVAILEMVKSTSEVVSTMLPSFWRISKGFIEGKFKRPMTNGTSITGTAVTRRSPAQCRTMAYDIVKLYISLISQAFMLSDVSVMSLSRSSSSRLSLLNLGNDQNGIDNFGTPPSLFPERSNSLLAAVHLQRILNEVVECSNELIALDISSEAKNGLKSLVDSLKWRCGDVLVHEWVQDAGIFYHLESWMSDSSVDVPKSKYTLTSLPATRLLAQFQLFQRYMATAAHKITSVNIAQTNLPSRSPSVLKRTSVTGVGGNGVMPMMYATKVTRGFLDAVYKLFDGLVLLASDECPAIQTAANDPVETKLGGELNILGLLDLRDRNARLLLVITNLERLRKIVIPSMFTQLESAFGVSMAEDQATLSSVVEDLDQTLFKSYIECKATLVKEQIRQALLGGEIDWYRAPQPIAVRRYVPEIMNYLVEVHGQVYNVAPTLVERVLFALIGELGDEVSTCLKKVARFGTGGLLQIVMELTFIHKSLAHYGRETSAGKKLEDIYTKEVTQAYSPSSKENKDFQIAFDEMQETLANARKSTGVQFLCFRKGKEKEKEKEGNKDGARKEKTRTRGTRNN